MSHHTTVAERIETDRAQIADVREKLARVDELAVKVHDVVASSDEVLAAVDRGLEVSADVAVKARRVAPRVAMVALGIVVAVGVVIVIRKRSAKKDAVDAD